MMTAGVDVEVLYVRERLREGEIDDSHDLVPEKTPEEQGSDGEGADKTIGPLALDADAMVVE